MIDSQRFDNVTRPVKITCRKVWKIFGTNAERLFTNAHVPSDQDLEAGGHIPAVRDASFEVIEGEIFVIMGLSGSGKSTLVRCMTRLIRPSAGEVLFDGRDLMTVSETELIELRRHKMGMVFQHFALLPHRTVLGNVAFPLEVQGISKTAREERAAAMVELVGLKGRETDYPRALSGGQQQRVGIARSLAVEPDVWFLDEPFSALDPLIRKEMQDEFLRLQSVLHKTIVFITHDFDEAIRLADRIAIMKDGAIIQIGRPEELVLNPADDYVEEFTSGIPRAKVLTVRSIMTASGAGPFSGKVRAGDRIEALLRDVLESDSNTVFQVIDDSGSRVGELSRSSVVDVLASTGRRV